MAADDVAQQIGEPSASSLKTACPLNVEHHEDGMHIGRCPVAHTSIERAKIGKDRLQPFVVGEAADESIGRHEKILRMGKQAHLLRATEMENIDMPGHLIDGIDILFQVLFFLWEISRERVDESLPGVGDFKNRMVLHVIEFVGARLVHIPQVHRIIYSKILAQPANRSTFTHTYYGVHAGVELHTLACESLESAPDSGILLENRHSQPFFGKESPAKQASQSASYDNDRLFHAHASIICLYKTGLSMSSPVVTTAPTSTPNIPCELMFCPVCNTLGTFIR